MIVAPTMVDAIVRLSRGETPNGYADSAELKPKGEFSGAMDIEVIRSAFANCMNEAHRRVTLEVSDRRATARLTHPWFGPLSARYWNWLLGSHQWVHRKQIEEIIKRSV